ncbi:MAG: pilus assembly protein N-terminal domain-containing protein [Planctomycetota bacterium]
MLHRLFPLVLFVAPLAAQATEADADGLRRLVRGTHDRLTFDKEIERIAVGDPEMMSIESITTREVLVRGVEIGRTSIVLWFEDGTIESSQWVIQPDLRVLENALLEIHPSITARIAPDRDAIVLRGFVEDQALAVQAEAVTRDYLQVGQREDQRDARTVVSRTSEGEAFVDDTAQEPSETMGATSQRSGGSGRNRSTVINMIRFPPTEAIAIESRIEAAISSVAGPGVVVRRIRVGSFDDNQQDVFLLEGAVEDQIALTRVIQLSARVLDPGGSTEIEVVANESGGLASAANQRSRGQGGQGGQGGAASGMFGGGGNALQMLQNRLEANIGRATVLSAANGRVLSFLEVRHTPQVRLEVQFYEINRSKLRSRGIDIIGLGANFDEPGLLPGPLATSAQGSGAALIGEDDAQGVAGWLGGTLSGQFQLNAGRFAMDAVLNYLETEGVARSLSRPSMVVLSGESALFQVGGEVPIVNAVGNQSVVGFGVVFREFGIQLAVRPMVGRHGEINVDLSPQIVLPDASLTAQIRDTTGTAQETTAFSSRTLQTTARLYDGEVVVLGGLMSRNDNEDRSNLPGLADLPLIGWIFENESRNSDEIELIVVVNPVVVHERRYETALWELASPLTAVFDSLLGRAR